MDVPQEFRDLLDRERITALVSQYVATLDDGDFNLTWGRSLFTDDVRIEFPLGSVNGVDRVVEQHHVVMSSWARTLHFSTDHFVELDGDWAGVRGRLVALHIHTGAEQRTPLVAAQRLEADVVRTDEGWRFARLALRPVWTVGEPPPGLGQTDH